MSAFLDRTTITMISTQFLVCCFSKCPQIGEQYLSRGLTRPLGALFVCSGAYHPGECLIRPLTRPAQQPKLFQCLLHRDDESTMGANTRCGTNVDLMLVQSRRRWANIKSTLVQCLVFVGMRASTGLHSTLTQCLFKVGPASKASDQH